MEIKWKNFGTNNPRQSGSPSREKATTNGALF
jgi:hypothetical protein